MLGPRPNSAPPLDPERVPSPERTKQGLRPSTNAAVGETPPAMSYADTWKPTRAAEAPVEIILAFGEPDSETTLMDWAREPEPAVVVAVRELREDSNFLMAVDLPWEVWDGGRPENTRGTFVVLGASESSSSQVWGDACGAHEMRSLRYECPTSIPTPSPRHCGRLV